MSVRERLRDLTRTPSERDDAELQQQAASEGGDPRDGG